MKYKFYVAEFVTCHMQLSVESGVLLEWFTVAYSDHC
jgi:hypothetical protein